jgi:hypothetical protein
MGGQTMPTDQPRIDSRDVMDANAQTTRAFTATVLGRFRRTGPNAWDDYEWVDDQAGTIAVAPGIPVQLEPEGADVRLRRHGEVVRVRWEPESESEVAAALAGAAAAQVRAHFVEHYLALQGAPPGVGAAAVIAAKLSE